MEVCLQVQSGDWDPGTVPAFRWEPKNLGKFHDQISVEVDLNLAFWTSVVVLRLYSATSRHPAACQLWTYGHVWEIGIIPQALPSQGHQMDLSLLLAIGSCVSVFDNMQNLRYTQVTLLIELIPNLYLQKSRALLVRQKHEISQWVNLKLSGFASFPYTNT